MPGWARGRDPLKRISCRVLTPQTALGRVADESPSRTMHSPPCFPGGWFNPFAHEEVETRRAMTAEQQLERSVLEGKERDELHAIAQALSVKTTTRTKKADMIDGILKATGAAA